MGNHLKGTLDMFTVNGIALADFVPLATGSACRHSNDELVGYVVRKTIDNGQVIWNDARTECGFDVVALSGANRFAEAQDLACLFRGNGEYAAVDRLFACGCRS